jgi:hypothetical protein
VFYSSLFLTLLVKLFEAVYGLPLETLLVYFKESLPKFSG